MSATAHDCKAEGRGAMTRRKGEITRADLRRKISLTSPTARALIGKTKGATVEVNAPGGTKAYKIRQVEWAEASTKNREQL